MRDAEQTIGKLVDNAKLSFVAYLDEGGFPAVRAMLPPREREGIKTFYFSTNTSSKKVQCYRENPKASIYFVDKRFFRGINLRGTMEVLEDAQSKERIWRSGDTMYYSKGVTDPDYCVLRFTAEQGRYYSSFRSEDFSV